MSNEDETREQVEEDAIGDLELKDEDADQVAGGVIKSGSDTAGGLNQNVKPGG